MNISAVNATAVVVREVANTKAEASKPSQSAQIEQAKSVQSVPKGGVTRSELEESVRTANERLAGRHQQVALGVDSESGTVIVTVTDAKSGQVVRQIPSEEALRITRNIDELTGILVDTKE